MAGRPAAAIAFGLVLVCALLASAAGETIHHILNSFVWLLLYTNLLARLLRIHPFHRRIGQIIFDKHPSDYNASDYNASALELQLIMMTSRVHLPLQVRAHQPGVAGLGHQPKPGRQQGVGAAALGHQPRQWPGPAVIGTASSWPPVVSPSGPLSKGIKCELLMLITTASLLAVVQPLVAPPLIERVMEHWHGF